MDARTNQLTASFPSETAKQVYCEFAAASDACYNSINYRRQQAYFTDDESVWDAPVRKLREEYVPVIGSGTFDQIERKNADAWESFLSYSMRSTILKPVSNGEIVRAGLLGQSLGRLSASNTRQE